MLSSLFGTFCVCGVIFYLCDCCTPKVVRPISLCLMVLRWSQPPHTPSHSGGKRLSVPPNPWQTKMRDITVRFSVAMTLSSHLLQTFVHNFYEAKKRRMGEKVENMGPCGASAKGRKNKKHFGIL